MIDLLNWITAHPDSTVLIWLGFCFGIGYVIGQFHIKEKDNG